MAENLRSCSCESSRALTRSERNNVRNEHSMSRVEDNYNVVNAMMLFGATHRRIGVHSSVNRACRKLDGTNDSGISNRATLTKDVEVSLTDPLQPIFSQQRSCV